MGKDPSANALGREFSFTGRGMGDLNHGSSLNPNLDPISAIGKKNKGGDMMAFGGGGLELGGKNSSMMD